MVLTAVERSTYYKCITPAMEWVCLAPVLMVFAGHGHFSKKGMHKTPTVTVDFLVATKKTMAASYNLRKAAALKPGRQGVEPTSLLAITASLA